MGQQNWSNNSVFSIMLLILILLIVISSVFSTPHTSSNVTVNTYSSCQFAHLYELNFYFVNMTKIHNVSKDIPIHKFKLDYGEVLEYGLVLTNKSNFNMLYSLTCIKIDNETLQSPKTTFVTGADGPDKPNINVLNYYGGKGTFEIVYGVGENYQFYFP